MERERGGREEGEGNRRGREEGEGNREQPLTTLSI